MTFTIVQLGTIPFREDLNVTETTDGSGSRVLALTGQESIPRLAFNTMVARREDLSGLVGMLLPVQFATKSYLNGFYRIQDCSSDLVDWSDMQPGVGIFSWKANLMRVGPENEVDIESRLSGAVTRSNAFAATGERSHAPAVGSVAYYTQASSPSTVTRSTTDGNIILYRGLPDGVNPRWATSIASYSLGRVRFLDDADRERAGTTIKVVSNDWTLTNGLVQVQPLTSGGVLAISLWNGSAWEVKNWDILVGGGPTTIGAVNYVRVVRNQYEIVTVRLTKSLSQGRVAIDVTLRRGSRLVELFVRHEYSTTTKIVRATSEASSATSGYVIATSNDANGDKFIVGSAQTFTTDLTNGGISKASSVTMDAFVGVVKDGTGAVAGDQAAHLYSQYLGMPAELIQGVRR